MKKIWEYVSRKKYYMLLLSAVLVTMIITFATRLNQESKLDVIDLNENDTVSNEVNDVNEYYEQIVENDLFIESINEGINNQDEVIVKPSVQEDLVNNEDEVIIEANDIIEENSENPDEPVAEAFSNNSDQTISAKKNDIVVTKNTLSFDQEKGIIMPLEGKFIMTYDDKLPAYFATLDQYKICNALYIEAKAGQEVRMIFDGRVEKVENDPVYGVMATVNHGDNVQSVYGQLNADIAIKEGDFINQGEVIGLVEEPTKFFVVEGEHLYFKMIRDGKAVNPNNYEK